MGQDSDDQNEMSTSSPRSQQVEDMLRRLEHFGDSLATLRSMIPKGSPASDSLEDAVVRWFSLQDSLRRVNFYFDLEDLG